MIKVHLVNYDPRENQCFASKAPRPLDLLFSCEIGSILNNYDDIVHQDGACVCFGISLNWSCTINNQWLPWIKKFQGCS